LLEGARERRRNKRVEIAKQPKRPDHADEIGDLTRLASFQADQRALRDARLASQFFLGEVSLKPEPRQAVP
jgi:hypothetical protein